MTEPKRIQRKRTKGWRMPAATLYVGRTRAGNHNTFANPFRVGGWFKIGNGKSGFMFLEAHPEYADASFTKIETKSQAVEMYREYRRRYPLSQQELQVIRDHAHVACWCGLDDPCHGDVLLELANR